MRLAGFLATVDHMKTPAIFGLSGPELLDSERDFFRDADPAGYILFARNCVNAQQLRKLTDDVRAIHGRDRLIISIDQEGGRVARMKPPEWTRYPAGEVFASLYEIAPASAIEAVRVNAQAMALELGEAGITVDYHAPLDVRRPETDNVIGDRALGSEPMQVAALGRAMLDGMQRGGVVGCLKHMPGHGRATCDSHKEMPVVSASAEELETDIAPFRALSDAPIGMSAHIVFTAWDADHPATQSPTVISRYHSRCNRLRWPAADGRYRHAGPARHDRRTVAVRAGGRVRYRPELLGEDGRYGGHCRDLPASFRRQPDPARARARCYGRIAGGTPTGRRSLPNAMRCLDAAGIAGGEAA